MRIRLVLLAAVAALTVLVPTAAQSGPEQTRELVGVVGTNDRFDISLTDEAGNPVRVLRPGTYTIRISDRSAIHNFHLTGPNVDIRTPVSGTGETTRTVTLRAGTYTYVCDPHARMMRGSFSVEAPVQRPAPLAVGARLDARQEVPRPRVRGRRPVGRFTGAVTRRGAAGTIRWRLTFRRLTGRALAAHIHLGRRGRAGPVAAPLCGPCRPGVRGATRLSARALRAVLRGGAYVNVHTRRNPAGEIRGQLRRSR